MNSLKDNLKVSEHPDFLNINEEFLEQLRDEAFSQKSFDYFEASLKFYKSVKELPVNNLSPKQFDWLTNLSSVIHDRLESGQLQINETKESLENPAPKIIPLANAQAEIHRDSLIKKFWLKIISLFK